ncbi:MAG: replicative helicase [Haloplasmataceae bacterium]|jgi:replicative DNA helicase|nr:replicative helicase [Haloplasmataceae bacterium]
MAQSVPFNNEAEQSIIGAIFLDNRVLINIVDKIRPEDFYQMRHQILFSCIVELTQESYPIDITTVTTKLKNRNQFLEVGGLDYLLELSEMVPTTANINTYVEIVHEKAVARKLIDTANQIAQNATNGDTPIDDLLDDAEKKIMLVARNRSAADFKEISNVVHDVYEKIKLQAENGTQITGLQTGFSRFDGLTLGLQKEDLFILAARPAMGKTAFVLNLAKNVAKFNNNPGIAIFSLEMSAEQLVNRLLTSEAQIDAQNLRKGILDSNEVNRLLVACDTLSHYNIYIDDTPGIKVSEVRAKCRKLFQAKDKNLGLIIIDYLQLLTGSTNNGGNRQQEVSEISRTLKEIAREFKVPVIACAQLSRQVETREDKKPIMADLRESGSIEQDADIVAFLYRDDYYNKQSTRQGQVDVIFAKHRHGPTGEVPLFFNRQCSSFSDIDNYHEPENSGY